jgi:hypothetical protein
VQRDEHAIERLLFQTEQLALGRIERISIHAGPAQSREHGVAGQQRDLALAGLAAEQHRHLAEAAHALAVERCAHARSPTIRTSRSSMTLNLSQTMR